MKWDILGKIVVRALPNILELIEHIKHKGDPVSKKDAALDLIEKEMQDIAAETGTDILQNPKVEVALNKAIDALVEVQNVIADLRTHDENK